MHEIAQERGIDAAQLAKWVRRRCNGEPFQYIVGTTQFYSIELEVGAGVLIPRPETEILVDLALERLKSANSGGKVLDLCTGSGAIPLAMANERPDFDYTGVDLSEMALKWARRNCDRLKPRNCHFRLGDLFSPVGREEKFILITANPPYVSVEEYQQLDPVVKDYEPRMALEAGDKGLAVARRIAAEAPDFLLPGGTLIMEIGDTQGDEMRGCLKKLGYHEVTVHADLAGRDRFVSGRIA